MDILGISGFDNGIRFKRSRFPNLERRRYRIVQGLDSAAVLVRDGAVAFAVAEERLTRDKGTGAFPQRAIEACLAGARLDPDRIDCVAHCFDYGPCRDLFGMDPDLWDWWSGVYDPQRQAGLLERHFPGVDWCRRLVAVPHHLAHAASAFYPSGFQEALVMVSDGMGELDSLSIYAVVGKRFEPLASISAFHSLGVLYGVFTLYLGFAFGMDEYQVMGLAPYGNPERYRAAVMDLVQLRDDGTYLIPLFASDVTPIERETHDGVLAVLAKRFGPPRLPGDEITDRIRDLAAAVQAVFETVQIHVLGHFARVTGLPNLCLAGGTSLNATSNGKVLRSALFRRVFVQPASGDDGAALGAALWVHHERAGAACPRPTDMPLWGPGYHREEIRGLLASRDDVSFVEFTSLAALIADVAQRLADGQILGWFQGRMEFGPRALGSRSILADPRPDDMQLRVNQRIKKRDEFRPFAPAVLAEAASTYFEMERGEEDTFAHMLFVVPVRPAWRDRLPAVTHVDGTARVQTVRAEMNPRFHALLSAFEVRTGLPILLNTSFNVKGQPIVCTPAEAVDTAIAAGLDALVLGDFLVTARAT